MVIGFGVLALVVITLTRGRLGYQTYRQDVLVPASRWAGRLARLSAASSAEKVLIRPVPQARVTP
jgi:hypothetical protein